MLNRIIFLIIILIVFVQCGLSFALTNNVSMEGHLQITRVDGNLWVTDPVGSGGAPVTIGIASEVGGQLLDYGCNYQQLFDNQTGKINTTIAGGYFRIDLRPAYDNEFFNVKWIPPAGLQASEITLYSVSTRGAMSMIGGVRAATYESFIPIGTPPITVVSTTTCTNLNADMVDRWHLGAASSAGMLLTSTSTTAAIWTFPLSVETVATGTTYETITTVANERLMVWANGDCLVGATFSAITLEAGGTSKDTVVCVGSAAAHRFPFSLFCTEVPGATTTTYMIRRTNGTLNNCKIMILRMRLIN